MHDIFLYRKMRTEKYFISFLVLQLSFSCVPVEKIARHDFDSGFYKLKTLAGNPSDVYVHVINDSITVYPLVADGKNKSPDKNSFRGININRIRKDNNFYRSSFISNSFDADLTTIILKYRPPKGGVPNQLSSNINAALYLGFRKDFYKVIPHISPLGEETSFIRHIGFDAGVFAGIGITALNPTVTRDAIIQEYDGMVFQKGVAGFISFDNMSVGITIGFDNLLDKNKTSWIYNQKPYIGLLIGISNF
jgi:hypothetical protein